jgi:endonuclease/exonuclease/phosphatase family metal-dependent hydrolase
MRAWILALLLIACRREPPALRLATFNIEDFPKNPAQVRGAFDELLATHAEIIAVQEIDDPALFARAAHERFGRQWQFVPSAWTQPEEHSRHLGVLFDTTRWQLAGTTLHTDTTLGVQHKPTLEVDLLPVGGGDVIRVLVVHLKAGSDGHDIRMLQLAALGRILDRLPAGSHTVVMGDFNATEDGDRTAIARIAGRRLTWATQSLACSAFWRREDSCPRSRLDHVLTWRAPHEVEALGACKRDGCATQNSCPLYATQISDHCPVAITL